MGTRRFVAVAVVALVALSAVGCGDSGDSGSKTTTRGKGTAWEPKPGPFTEPEQLHSINGVLEVDLEAKEQVLEVAGAPVQGVGYNGSFIGPTLHVRPGDTLRIGLANRLDQVTNLHYHGLHVSPTGNSDNIALHVMPGETQRYEIKLPPDHAPGLYWYHAHAHGDSAGQVFRGLAGLIVVEGLKDMLPDELRGITERQLALKDVYTNPDQPGVLPKEGDIGGMKLSPATVNQKGPRLVNGVYRPQIPIRPGETQLWHVANVGANMFQTIAIPGATFDVIAEDGNPVWEVWRTRKLKVPPGKRFDVLLQGPAAGSYPLQSLKMKQGVTPPPSNLLGIPLQRIGSVVSKGAPVEPVELPRRLSPAARPLPGRLDDVQIAKRRRFAFAIPFIPGRACKTATDCPGVPGGEAGSRAKFTINGKKYSPDRVDVRPKLGTVEEWTLTNSSFSDHPFHIHVNDFQVMSINGKPHRARGLQDVAILPSNGSMVIRIPFRTFTGSFVFHCHILDHQDGGMMASVSVIR